MKDRTRHSAHDWVYRVAGAGGGGGVRVRVRLSAYGLRVARGDR